MTLTIPDSAFKGNDDGFTERMAQIDFACWLFERQRLGLWPAAQVAGMSRSEFECELLERKIPIYRVELEDLLKDDAAMRALRG